ncbi:hypothetical protein RB195_000309 [Necator americanus]|uniref:Uncharacterized protein n=1 Tax=Necator americanus TaxID=51031 RepID=A0ABR1DC13_NECAM
MSLPDHADSDVKPFDIDSVPPDLELASSNPEPAAQSEKVVCTHPPSLSPCGLMSFSTKIPKKVSEYIVDFYLENSLVLLRNASSRNITVNNERDQLYEQLARNIETDFGLVFDRKKIKTHFEHFKHKTLAKGAKMLAGINRQTKSGRDGIPEELRAVNPRACAFDMSEFKLWSYLNDSPVTIGEHLAGCSVMLQPCTSISMQRVEQNEPANVDTRVDYQESGNLEEKAGSPTSSGSTDSDSVPDTSRPTTSGFDNVDKSMCSPRMRRKRKYDDLLDEQILMYREQRRFFSEMANAQVQMSAMVGTLHDVVKTVMQKLVGSDVVRIPQRCEDVPLPPSLPSLCHEKTEKPSEVPKITRMTEVKREDSGCSNDARGTTAKVYRAKGVEHKGYRIASRK